VGDLLVDFQVGNNALAHLYSGGTTGLYSRHIAASGCLCCRPYRLKVFFLLVQSRVQHLMHMHHFATWLTPLLAFRVATGFFCGSSGGYKIAADHFEKGLGKSLGLPVGALYWAPHSHLLVRIHTGKRPGRTLLLYISGAPAVFGGLMMHVFVPRWSIPQTKSYFRVDLGLQFGF
jgi:hypothetical protein